MVLGLLGLAAPSAAAHNEPPACQGLEAGPACTDTVWACFFAVACRPGGAPDAVPFLCLNPDGCAGYVRPDGNPGQHRGHENGEGHEKNGH